jgi:hypothetical protein
MSGTVIMAPWGWDHSIGREGRCVIRTIDFAPTRIRRNDFWAQSSTICCAGLMSAVTFATALHSPTNDMAVDAGAFDHRAHPIALARFLSLASAFATDGLGGGNEHAQVLHLEDVSASSHAIS